MNSFESAATFLGMRSAKVLVLELAVMALAIAIVWAGATVLLEDKPPGIEPADIGLSMLVMTPLTLSLLFRRRFPLLTLVFVTVLFQYVRLKPVAELQVSSVAIVAAFYAAGRYGVAPWRNIVRAASALALALSIVYQTWDAWDQTLLFGFSTQRSFVLTVAVASSFNVLLFGATWFLGDSSRNRHERERELAARTLELEASREENARRAVMDERVRIAREIHDVVAHHVSVMGIQAGAARRILESEPMKAAEPLRAIEGSSREAVTELHRLLGFLRRADEPDPDSLEATDPTPGLARLGELRNQVADAGIATRYVETGTPRPLPPSVDLSAFRILQEALTNCLKYAGVDVVDVCIDYGETALGLAVRDRGRGPQARVTQNGSAKPKTPGGAGLPGMAERVALLGGTLQHGERDGGGFEVEALLPYDGQVTAAPQVEVTA